MTTPRTTQGDAGRPPFRRGGARRRRQCYCKESTVDYKDVAGIRRFITDLGRIEAGKKSGNCAKCQRNLTTAIKRARHLALLPYAPDHLRVTGTVSTGGKISDEDETTTDEDNTDAHGATEAAVVVEDAPVAEVAEESTEEAASEETEEVTEDVPSKEAPEAADDSSDEEEK
ncbi:MAG: 30S ribosomal protein S18 [Chloroflexi bacterium]|nr:30S ribosomal protein S18 [Chloroflexota bacterium]MDA1281101.1 30S ribosomal protein S18 [Chloroflexota bacterium]